ncbi:hypothetical protein KSP35_22605 [Aquihabitans sp. G128]|uniref:DUF6869 domain-containing protein n=1 Tax=Aquihabitans sp. G128 TaxID=2849779 RepID=UPI001C23BE10|nr:hypothetical protein [Aquihabitans sp. G128]QXC61068.1 hypothetical protein KSP35_22605 [Aquihabitans sp. G128]
MVEQLASSAPDEEALSRLGAGALEDLLEQHGPQLVTALEDAVRQSPELRTALTSVWYSGRDPAVLQRLTKFGLAP